MGRPLVSSCLSASHCASYDDFARENTWFLNDMTILHVKTHGFERYDDFARENIWFLNDVHILHVKTQGF